MCRLIAMCENGNTVTGLLPHWSFNSPIRSLGVRFFVPEFENPGSPTLRPFEKKLCNGVMRFCPSCARRKLKHLVSIERIFDEYRITRDGRGELWLKRWRKFC